MEIYKYTIGGKTYIQTPLVLGQVRQLINLLEGITIPHDFNTLSLISAIGDKISLALAILLTEESKPLKDKNLDQLANELEFEISTEMTIEVIEHFFDLNNIVYLSEKLGNIALRISKSMTGSMNSASFSQEETLQSEMKSFGDIHPKSASHILNAVSET